MSTLPRVSESTREQIAREFDDLGPDACIADISTHLQRYNPEWLSMATKCALDASDPKRILSGFCMFYRLLTAQVLSDSPLTDITGMLTSLPRITTQTRAAIVAAIDENSVESFVNNAILQLESTNPELLQMAHYFASTQANYLATMQGFALLYAALLLQSGADRPLVH